MHLTTEMIDEIVSEIEDTLNRFSLLNDYGNSSFYFALRKYWRKHANKRASTSDR